MTKQKALEQLDEVWSLLANVKEYQFNLKTRSENNYCPEILKTQQAVREAIAKILILREAIAKM